MFAPHSSLLYYCGRQIAHMWLHLTGVVSNSTRPHRYRSAIKVWMSNDRRTGMVTAI
jgi:hypothetical protein